MILTGFQIWRSRKQSCLASLGDCFVRCWFIDIFLLPIKRKIPMGFSECWKFSKMRSPPQNVLQLPHTGQSVIALTPSPWLMLAQGSYLNKAFI